MANTLLLGARKVLGMTGDDAHFWAALARKRIGAGALVRDMSGRPLLVEPTYKDTWEIPGGAVEEGETAVAACERECKEELGLELESGRLLVVDHQTDSRKRGDSIMFVYDGGTLADLSNVCLQTEELRSCGFVEETELDSFTAARLASRGRFALEALSSGRFIELSKGVPRLGA